MADKKITQLTSITGANLADADEFVVVDISADETKAITLGELKEAFDSGSGFVRITGDTMTGDLGFGDNDKAIFGAGSDLQIFHNGIDSYIQEAGTGRLYIRGSDSVRIQAVLGSENMAIFNENGSVQLYHDNSEKLETTSTGIDVTGTVTADGLTVDGLSIGGIGGLEIEDPSASGYGAHFSFYDASSEVVIGGKTAGSTNKSLSIGRDTGDISFYEDTGTTPKFFWDASAEGLSLGTTDNPNSSPLYIRCATDDNIRIQQETHASIQAVNNAANAFTELKLDGSSLLLNSQSGGNVGIGTSSPTRQLDVSKAGTAYIRASDTSSSVNMEMLAASSGGWIGTQTNHSLNFQTNNTERLRITTAGNVGIGTSSPSANLEITQSGNNVGLLVAGGGYNYTAKFESSDAEANIIIEDSNSTNDGNRIGVATNDMYFITDNSERMRIDSSGNVGIGTSSPNGSGLHIRKDTSATTNELLRLSNSAGSTTDGVKLVMEVANTSGNGGEIGTVRDGGSFNPYMYFSTSAGVGSSPSERMRIDSNGHVAIGGTTVTDVNMLNIQGSGASSNIGIVFNDTNTSKVYGIQNGGSTLKFFDYTASAERMRIDSSGNLLVGTTGVLSGSVDGANICVNPINEGSIRVSRSSGSNANQITFWNTNGKVGSITTVSTSTSFNTSSDHRLKENVADLTGATTRLKQLEPKRFNFIADANTTVDGFLAHEVQTIVPEAITGTHNEVDADGNPVYQGIDQSKLVPLLVATIKELEARITALENA